MMDYNMNSGQRMPEDITSWLVERVAHYVQRPGEEIDSDISVTETGLDSVYAFSLCGEIEDRFGMAVEPVLVWELDTLTALAAHLAGLAFEKSLP